VLSPDAMFTITAVVCLVVIGAVALSGPVKAKAAELAELANPDLTHAEAMRILDAPEAHPPGVLSGLWGRDANAEAWWWRCSLCREFDHSLTPVAAALEASSHQCQPKALEAAELEAKRVHPAFQDTELGRRYLP
jgi:hypothetical protein